MATSPRATPLRHRNGTGVSLLQQIVAAKALPSKRDSLRGSEIPSKSPNRRNLVRTSLPHHHPLIAEPAGGAGGVQMLQQRNRPLAAEAEAVLEVADREAVPGGREE